MADNILQSNDESKQDNKEADDEEKKEEITIQGDKLDKESFNKLSKTLQDLYNHQAKYKLNKDGSITFEPTPNCEPANKLLPQSNISWTTLVSKNACDENKIEAQYDSKAKVINSNKQFGYSYKKTSFCSFITSALTAWSQHYPFRFKVEHIWLLILQAVAIHVDQNAEKLRDKFVKHDGKKKLEVIRNSFRLGSADNDWEGVIKEFADQIDKSTVEDTVQLFDCDFSSSTMLEKICAKITLMDICKNYFEYVVSTRCGFPQITIDGTKDDWIKLKQKCKMLLEKKVAKTFSDEWGKALLPLIDRFIVAFDGKIDCIFWNSMIKKGAVGGSGGYSYFSGWFNILFPFLKNRREWDNDFQKEWNEYCVPYSIEAVYVNTENANKGNMGMRFGHGGKVTGAKISRYPSGLSTAPVTWNYFGKELPLKFLAGFNGYLQDEKTLEICPNIGWCIAHEKVVEKEKDNDM